MLELINFLQKEGVLYAYLDNYIVKALSGPVIIHKSHSIGDAFTWTETPEGGDFWVAIYHKYEKLR